MKALVSVSNKKDLEKAATMLRENGYTEIISTGGTARKIREAGIPVTEVSDVTGFPEILDGRLKTLHPKIHGAFLATKSAEHLAQIAERGIGWIDLLVVDLYPFEATIAKPGVTDAEAIEQIDIGGPAMLRSIAKGSEDGRFVFCSIRDLLQWFADGMPQDAATRRKLMAKVFATTARYDLAIARHMSGGDYDGIIGERAIKCHYGENAPQVPAGYYVTEPDNPFALHRYVPVGGKTASYNNLNDLNAVQHALRLFALTYRKNFGTLPRYMAFIVKHKNLCGAAFGDNALEVIRKMIAGDPVAAFGGVLNANFPITSEHAELLATYNSPRRRVFGAVAAPSIEEGAREKLLRKDEGCRLLENPALLNIHHDILRTPMQFTSVEGGFLAQPASGFVLDIDDPEMERLGPELTEAQRHNLALAFAVCESSISNDTSVVDDSMLIGNGAGCTDRQGAGDRALFVAKRGGHETKGAVAATDSFFFDGAAPTALVAAGVSVIYATKPNRKDEDVCAAATANGGTLLRLPDAKGRIFRH